MVLIFELIYDVFLTYCDIIELILYECIMWWICVQRVYETLWIISIVRDYIGILCNMYIFIYCYCGWIWQFWNYLVTWHLSFFFFFNYKYNLCSRVLKYVIFWANVFWQFFLGHCFWQCNLILEANVRGCVSQLPIIFKFCLSMLYEITNRAYSGAHAQCVVDKDAWTHVICMIMWMVWCFILHKILFKNQLDVLFQFT